MNDISGSCTDIVLLTETQIKLDLTNKLCYNLV